jgi:hypothetical protein
MMLDNILSSLEDSRLADLKVIETTSEDIVEEVDQTEDTLTILGKYVDSSEGDYDKGRLKTLLGELYSEAIMRIGNE